MRVAVVGGGICGLSAAHDLLRAGADTTLFEASSRLGGLLGSECFDGFEVELGADSILTDKPWALALARELGLENAILPTRSHPRGAYLVHRGRLVRVPEGFSLMAPTRVRPMWGTPLLSRAGRARMWMETLVPARRDDADESLESFVVRRFGRELFDRMAQPLVGGIYGADPKRLSLQATMPRFQTLEREFGSVIRGLRARQAHARTAATGAATGARYGLFAAFRGGMQTLVDALAASIGSSARLGVPVARIEQTAKGYRVVMSDGSGEEFDQVLLALPAHASARLLARLAPELATALRSIPYGSAATVTYAFERGDIPHTLDAFGFVVPAVEGRSIIASTWSSVKWEGRAPAGTVLLRVFIGGHQGQLLLERGDAELDALAARELRSLIGVKAEPRFRKVVRYMQAMPQYTLGHTARMDRLEQGLSTLAGLELAGNAYRGVGIPDAVRSGREAAKRLLQHGAVGRSA